MVLNKILFLGYRWAPSYVRVIVGQVLLSRRDPRNQSYCMSNWIFFLKIYNFACGSTRFYLQATAEHHHTSESLSAKSSSQAGTRETTSSAKPKPKRVLTEFQKKVLIAKKKADARFKDENYYKQVLNDKTNKDYHFAVLKHLSDPDNLKKALKDKKGEHYAAAKRIKAIKESKAYLSKKKNYKKALNSDKNKHHAAAVRTYFSKGDNYKKALNNKSSRFHDKAVEAYLLDSKTRAKVLADKNHEYYRQAKKMQRKINKQKNRRQKEIKKQRQANSKKS